MLRCMILDMDGTLLDTERLSVIAWQEAGKKFGYDIPRDFIIHFFGMTREMIYERFRSTYGADFPVEEVRAQRVENGRVYFLDHPMPVKPGARELLECLKERGVAVAVATSTYYEQAVSNLKKAGLYDLVDHVVGGDMCQKSKPEPDIFLQALALCGFSRNEAVVIEDSGPGVRAGAASGCKCIMVPDLLEPDAELKSLAYCCCGSLFEVRDMVIEGKLD